METKNRTQGAHKYLPFRVQRIVVAFLVFGALASLSVGVIWNHVDGITTLSPSYKVLAKVGLGVVELIALFILWWELTARDKVLSMTCYVAEFILVVVMVVHAGAVLQLDASGSQQEKAVSFTADVMARVEAAKEAARIRAAGEATERLNNRGQHRAAAMIARSAASGSGSGDNGMLERVLKETKPTTFLPESYMEGGLFYWPPLIAFSLFMLVMLVSKGVIEYEDANGNGIPDHLEPWAHRDRPKPGFGSASIPSTPHPPLGGMASGKLGVRGSSLESSRDPKG